MSNLSDLLPAGAAAKQLTFTDSGSGISSKAPVVLKSDGTVSAITSTAFSVGAQSAAVASVSLANTSRISYDESANRVVAAYAPSGTNDFTLVAGEISGSTITWGTPLVVESSITAGNTFDVCFDASNNCMVYTFKKSGTSIVTGCATLSGSVITAHTANEASVNFNINRVYNVYDATNNKVLVYGAANSTNAGTMWSVSVSGTTPTYSSSAALGSINFDNGDAVHDPDQQRIVVATEGLLADTYAGSSMLVDCSGATPSSTSPVLFSSSNAYQPQIIYNTTDDKIVIGWYDNNNSSHISYIAGTVDAAGSTITYGTKTTQTGANLQYPSYGDMAYDPVGNQGLYVYYPSGGTYDTYMQTTTLSGTTVVIGSLNTIWDNPGSENYYYNSVVYDPDTSRLILFYGTQAAPYYPHGRVITPPSTNLTAQAFVGVADSAISASAAGSVIVQGGTVSGATADVTIAESLSSPFLYAQDAAGDAVGCKASGTGSDNFLIAYEINDGVARGALAQAATVTSGNISYGSSASIGGASTTVYNYSIAYDSTNDKFVVFWQNYSNGYIYGSVVTLTGNSISYGAETAVYSAAGVTGYGAFASTYDPDTDRVILGVCDNGDTYAYSVVIELGTTTIDTVGTAQKIDSASATVGYGNRIALCYDTTENKVIATYINQGGGGSYYLRVAAGTVAGGVSNSTTWGSSSVVYSGDAAYPSIAYNATDQRVVIVYKQQADTKGYSSVATVSGTTVTANTPSEFYDPASTGGWTLYFTSLAHDSYMNQMVIYMRASAGDAVYGAIDTGTNSITWSTPR